MRRTREEQNEVPSPMSYITAQSSPRLIHKSLSATEATTECISTERSVSSIVRRDTFYGTRERIPTKLDILNHPAGEWWSDARLDAPHVVEDLGTDPRILSRTMKVKIMSSSARLDDDEFDYFLADGMRPREVRRYMILQLVLGEKMIVAIAECFDIETFDSIYSDDGDLCAKLKLIVNPANVSIPWSITGPKNAASIRDFFGPSHCSIRRKVKVVDDAEIVHAVITIDVYSKFLIRSFLPKLAFHSGRISDYMICDYENRLIHTGFRIVGTSTLLDLMKKSKSSSST